MRKHADILRPKFELVLDTLDKELSGLGIGEWTKPTRRIFHLFDSLDGCAKAIVARAKKRLVLSLLAQVLLIHTARIRKTPTSVLHHPSLHLKILAKQHRYSYFV